MFRAVGLVVLAALGVYSGTSHGFLVSVHETRTVAEWQADVSSADEEHQLPAIACLAAYGKAATVAVPSLRNCFTSSNARIRSAALEALVGIYQASAESRTDTRGEDSLITALEANDDPIGALFASKNVCTDKCLPNLTHALNHEDLVVRYLALQRMRSLIEAATGGQYGGVGKEHKRKVEVRWRKQAEICLASLAATAGSDNPALARMAIQAIGAFGWYDSDVAVPAVPVIVAALKSEDQRLVREAAWTLSLLGAPAKSAVPALIELASQEEKFTTEERETTSRRWGLSSWAIRYTCLDALGSMGSNASIGLPLVLRAMADSNDDIKTIATYTLERIGLVPEAVPILVKNLTDKSDAIRARTADALSKSGASGIPAIPALTRALADPDSKVRFCAAMSLRDLASYSSSSLPELRNHLDDPDAFVRSMVTGAIAAIQKRTEQ